MPLETTGRFSRKSPRLRYSPCLTLTRYLMSHMDNNVIQSQYFTHAYFYSVWGQTDYRKQRKWTQNYRGGRRCRRKKRCESLTETHGLDVALGVGDRCTVTNAIQAPVNGYLRETGGGETDIIVSGDISRGSFVATALSRFLSETALRMRRNRQLSRFSGLKPWLTVCVLKKHVRLWVKHIKKGPECGSLNNVGYLKTY